MITTPACDGMSGTGVSRSGPCAHVLAWQPDGKALADLRVDRFRHVRGEMGRQNLSHFLRGALGGIEGALFGPFVRTPAIADRRVEISRLHQLQRLLRAQVVPRALET